MHYKPNYRAPNQSSESYLQSTEYYLSTSQEWGRRKEQKFNFAAVNCMSDENEAMFPVVLPVSVSFSRFTRPLLNGTFIYNTGTESSSDRLEMVLGREKQLLSVHET